MIQGNHPEEDAGNSKNNESSVDAQCPLPITAMGTFLITALTGKTKIANTNMIQFNKCLE